MSNGSIKSFKELLSESPTEVKTYKNIPEGPYVFLVKMPEYGQANSGNNFIKYPMQPLQPLDGVDQDALAEALNGDNLMDRELTATFWWTDKAISMLDEFHQNCGLELKRGVSRQQRCEQVVGSHVIGYVRHRQNNNNPGRFFAQVDGTAPVDTD